MVGFPVMRRPAGLRLASLVLLWCLANIYPAFAFDLQGHRGARALMPENTLPAFARALEIGVTTIETDLAVTRDDQLVLSHDPSLNPSLTRTAGGAWLKGPGPAIRSLSLAELQAYDVGRLDPAQPYAKQFTKQTPVDGTPIPTLAQLFSLAAASGTSPRFNLETKITPDSDASTPDPKTFARLVVAAVRAAKLEARTTIQSFDWRTLREVKALAPEIETSCLTIEARGMNTIDSVAGKPSAWLAGLDPATFDGSIPRTVQAVGCSTWSPYWRNLTTANVREAQAIGLKVLPWTVNTEADLAAVINLGVDGLITDDPELARKVLGAKGISLP
jgi:glycerophosphoryl diester phosphodiesterase